MLQPGLFPIRLGVVVLMNAVGPFLVGHTRPMILIETRSIFQSLLRHIKDKALVFSVQRERRPRYGKQFISHTQKTTEGKHGVSDTPARNIQHDMFYRP